MAIERTLSIIKPDAVAKNVIGKIVSRFEAAGLKIVAAKLVHLSRNEAEQFYAVHKERPFFKDLVEFMISGPGVRASARRRKRHRQEPRSDGRHRPQEGSRRHHPRRLRRQHRRQRRARFGRCRNRSERSRFLLRRPQRLRTLKPHLDRFHDHGQSARLRSRGVGRVLRKARREAIPRHAAVPLDPPAGRQRLHPDDRSGEVAARETRDHRARGGPAGHHAARIQADGTIKWLFDVGDGNAVEAVFIPEDDRGTLVRVVPGRLCGRLPLLLDRASGLQPQPEHGRDRRPALVCRALPAQAPRSATSASSPTW